MEINTKIKTKEEAREYAIEWQQWASEHKMFMSELVKWQQFFVDLGLNWGLTDEFIENGII